MSRGLSYRDAVRLLRGPEERAVDLLDRITTGAFLGGVVGIPDLLGWFDARAEFARLSRDLAARAPQRMRGASRHSRTRRIEAVHSVIVIAAYFEALTEVEISPRFQALSLTPEEEVGLAVGRPVAQARAAALAAELLDSPSPLPDPQWSDERVTSELGRFYVGLSRRLLDFVQGLALWEDAGDVEQQRFTRLVLDGVPGLARAKYEDLFRQLAVDFPEVRFWTMLREHSATRGELRAGLAALRTTLAAFPADAAAAHGISALRRSHDASLDRPARDRRGLPEGLQVPSLRDGYIDPCFSVAAEADGSGQAADLLTRYLSGDVGPRQGLIEFVVGCLTSTRATEAPLLVLGQPGSGKSVLTQVIAALLPEDFVAVRVPLRDVPAEEDIQTQIETALRTATGEALSWPAVVRAAGGALPVVLLDGFDELIQVTGQAQEHYLEKVREFQLREAELGRPVAVIVTSRSSATSYLRDVSWYTTLELSPFTEEQMRRWIEVWNGENRRYFESTGVEPLDLAAVLRQGDLAEQPLLLLMLALYDAQGNAVKTAEREINVAELYEALLRAFVDREVRKLRPDLPTSELHDQAERELARLSVAALGMFNRGRQSITEEELDHDLAALLPVDSETAGRSSNRRPLSQSQTMLGRFFFVQEAQALGESGRRRGYEFLHTTFGEYLIARFIRSLLEQMSEAPNAAAAGEITHAVLSWTPLAERRSALRLVDALVQAMSTSSQAALKTALADQFRKSLLVSMDDTYGGYAPIQSLVTVRYAAYSLNLFLLLLCASDGCIPVRGLMGETEQAFDEWRRHSGLWRAAWGDRPWRATIATIRARRSFEDGEKQLLLSHEDGTPVSFAESASLAWQLNDEVLFHEEDPEISVPSNSSLGEQLRSTALLANQDQDVLLDALVPFFRLRRNGNLMSMLLGSAITVARQEMTELLTHAPSVDDHEPEDGPPPSSAPPPPPH